MSDVFTRVPDHDLDATDMGIVMLCERILFSKRLFPDHVLLASQASAVGEQLATLLQKAFTELPDVGFPNYAFQENFLFADGKSGTLHCYFLENDWRLANHHVLIIFDDGRWLHNGFCPAISLTDYLVVNFNIHELELVREVLIEETVRGVREMRFISNKLIISPWND